MRPSHAGGAVVMGPVGMPDRPGVRLVALVVLSALAVSVAAACGGSASPAASSPAAPVASPPPTASQAAQATPVPTAPPAALTETLTAKAGGRSVRYPAGWTAFDNGGILYLSTNQKANDRLIGLGTLESGDVFIQFGENSILSGATADPAVHLPDNLRLLAEGSGFPLGAPVAITSKGRTGARIDASNGKLSMLAVSVKVSSERFADMIAYTTSGGMAGHEPLILAILDSLEYPAD